MNHAESLAASDFFNSLVEVFKKAEGSTEKNQEKDDEQSDGRDNRRAYRLDSWQSESLVY